MIKVGALDTGIVDYVIDVDAYPELAPILDELIALDLWNNGSDKTDMSAELYDSIPQRINAALEKRGRVIVMDFFAEAGGTAFNILATMKTLRPNDVSCRLVTYYGFRNAQNGAESPVPGPKASILLRAAKEVGVELVMPELPPEEQVNVRTPASFAFLRGGKKYVLRYNGKGAHHITPKNIGELLGELDVLVQPCSVIKKFGFEVYEAAINYALEKDIKIYLALPTSEIKQEHKDKIKELIKSGKLNGILGNIDELKMFLHEDERNAFPSLKLYTMTLTENGSAGWRREIIARQKQRAVNELLDLLPDSRTFADTIRPSTAEPLIWITDGKEKATLVKHNETRRGAPFIPEEEKINAVGAGDTSFGAQIIAHLEGQSLKASCKLAEDSANKKVKTRHSHLRPEPIMLGFLN